MIEQFAEKVFTEFCPFLLLDHCDRSGGGYFHPCSLHSTQEHPVVSRLMHRESPHYTLNRYPIWHHGSSCSPGSLPRALNGKGDKAGSLVPS